MADLADAGLYLCVGARPDLAEFLDAVLPNGVDVVQLREKGLEARAEMALSEAAAVAESRMKEKFPELPEPAEEETESFETA